MLATTDTCARRRSRRSRREDQPGACDPAPSRDIDPERAHEEPDAGELARCVRMTAARRRPAEGRRRRLAADSARAGSVPARSLSAENGTPRRRGRRLAHYRNGRGPAARRVARLRQAALSRRGRCDSRRSSGVDARCSSLAPAMGPRRRRYRNEPDAVTTRLRAHCACTSSERASRRSLTKVPARPPERRCQARQRTVPPKRRTFNEAGVASAPRTSRSSPSKPAAAAGAAASCG